MTDIRGLVRRTIPHSADAYEWGEHRIRLRGGRKKARELREGGQPLWLDLGGGARAGTSGWLTIDVTRQCDLYWDLRDGLPFATDSVDRVYSSHLFEHLEFRDGQALMAEALRVLRPGGSFSTCVPNARMYVESYLESKPLPDEYFGWEPAFNRTTAIDAINYVAYMDGHHKYMFDEANLVCRLELAGFTNTAVREFDPETDSAERHFESIYALGYKPNPFGG
jgi:predicted SAM-dependent methyltransferase